MTYERLLAAIVASLLLASGFTALIFGLADLTGATANIWMKTWEKPGYAVELKQWDVAHDRLRLARRLNPLRADHSVDLGRLMDWRAWQNPPGSDRHREYRIRAARYYREAIGNRPTWGYAWAHYAESKLLSGKRDGAFLQALEMAIVLSPWEPGVQHKTAWMGLAAWGDLPDHLRVLVKDNIRRVVKLDENVDEIVRIAVQFDWIEQLRSMTNDERHLALIERVLDQSERH